MRLGAAVLILMVVLSIGDEHGSPSGSPSAVAAILPAIWEVGEIPPLGAPQPSTQASALVAEQSLAREPVERGGPSLPQAVLWPEVAEAPNWAEPVPYGFHLPGPTWALIDAGVPGRLHAEFLSVAWCESGYDFDAVGDHGSSLGLFQIQPQWHLWRLEAVGEELDPLLLFDPVVNAKVAWHLYQEAGWGPWACAANDVWAPAFGGVTPISELIEIGD